MITIIKNIKVYGPEFRGIQDILLIGEKIAFIGSDISADFHNSIQVNVIDGEGKIAVPGFIDSHVHMLGGGGEGGYKTRTPEIMLTDLTSAGITTAVGCLGTDGVTRNMMSLLAKAKGLEEEGISAFIYTGSYQIPVRTLTGSIMEDLLAIDKIIGVGEIALSDHRSSQPTFDEFLRTAADARVGGMLSGKAGILDIHLGDGERGIEYIFRAIEETEIPISQFLPTHINRNPHLFEQGLNFARKGGYIDFTGSEEPELSEEAGEVSFGKGVNRLLEEGISDETFTLSSDAQGSLPIFNEKKEYIGLGVGSAKCLWKEIRHAILTEQIPLEIAIKAVTANPAKILKLAGKGRLENGYDADICIISEATMEIDTVIAKGQLMVKEKVPVVSGTFEKR
ncbi:MAG: beta-aspartyl-peptidase [Clostridiales bacterium]|nr:beta-aspartyl-peptidase [Clostridiales bacterium]